MAADFLAKLGAKEDRDVKNLEVPTMASIIFLWPMQ